MTVNMSVVGLLAVLVYWLLRKAGLKLSHAIACALFGFYLAESSVAPTVSEFVQTVADTLSRAHF